MTQREKLERNIEPTKAVAVMQKHKRDLQQKNNISNESDESKPRWVWSDLPGDIVRHIIVKLCWSDRIRLRAVCKSLRSLVHGIQTIDIFPWVMSYTWRKTDHGQVYSICRLADPFAQKIYVIEDATKGEERKDFVHAVPCASRNGWVLFQGWTLFFFYSPFTNEVIKLPELGNYHSKADFSMNPTSPDCVVFILSHNNSYKSSIWTWSPGDKTWTHLDLYELYGVYHRPLDVTYAGGIFYCVFENGRLGSYNAKLREWKIFANSLPVLLEVAFPAYLIESNEDKDLLLMCVFFGCWEVWRFDMSRECWVKEQRIGNRAIFLGCTSYSVPAVGRSTEFADKIYCLQDICFNKEPMCASLEDDALWLQTELYSWMPRISAEKSIWIQPPITN